MAAVQPDVEAMRMGAPLYKKLTYPQLRSFYESARLRNITAAAEFLDVAQPTVWKQVRALEAHLGTPLLVYNGRGCTLTAEGEILLKLATPYVGGIEQLVQRFQTEVRKAVRKLIVAVSPRPVEEELPRCMPLLEKRMPNIQYVLLQLTDLDVIPAVEAGTADLALTAMAAGHRSDAICIEPAYHLEPVLIVPKGHPLASKRRLSIDDLARYPLLNRAGTFPDQVVNTILDKAGAFLHPDRRVELNIASTIHLYVKLGYGIGLVGRVPGAQPYEDVVERSLSKLFGVTLPCYVAYRKHVVDDQAIRVFVDVLRDVLAKPGRPAKGKASDE